MHRIVGACLAAALLAPPLAASAPLDWRFGIEDTWNLLGNVLSPENADALAAKLELLTASQPAGGDVNLNTLAGGWNGMQPTALSAIDFSQSDAVVRRLQAHRFSLLWNLAINAPWASAGNAGCYGFANLPLTDCAPDGAHEQALHDYVQAIVERYDGDGFHDMGWETPDDPSDDLVVPVRSYLMTGEIEFAGANDPDDSTYGDGATAHFWSDTIPDLLRTHRIVYQAIHDADPTGATQLISSGGVFWDLYADFPDYPAIDGPTVEARLSGSNNHSASYTASYQRLVDLLAGLVDESDGKKCDAIGWHPHMGWREIPQTFAFIHAHAPGKPIYIDDMWTNLFLLARSDAPGYAQFTDGGTAIAGDFPNAVITNYTELVDWMPFNLFGDRDWYEGRTARQLVKSYVTAFGEGAERVGFSGDADFNPARLCCYTGWLNLLRAPDDDPPLAEKPAYWTFRTLTEKLHDFECVARVDVSSDPRTRVYRFERPRGPIWIGWSETSGAPPFLDYSIANGESVQIPVAHDSVLSTTLVDEVGVTDPTTATLAAPGGFLSRQLGYRPLVVEWPDVLFADGFECGDLAGWTSASP
jgi:hypothetical protein